MPADTEALAARARAERLTPDDAARVLRWPAAELASLLALTREIRQRHFGREVACCAIINAKSGRCGEDCGFCAQSARHQTAAACYPLLDGAQILRQRDAFPAALRGRFSIVTSGAATTAGDLARICQVARDHPHERVSWCASLGMLDEAALARLRAAGFTRYHHNLETAASYFGQVCTTHTYEQRVATVRAAQRAGLAVCSGVLFGLGESPEQRVEVACALRDLAVDAIPVNIQVPVAGTRLAGHAASITELDVLRALAMLRLVCPRQEVRLCGGREYHLKSLEGRIFDAGVTGIMIGGYLTVGGRSVAQDLARIVAAGYTPQPAQVGA
jgi:biotin synthase